MASKQKSQQKYGRNKAHCLTYKNEHRHEKSHIRRIKTHLMRYGKDNMACKALIAYATQVGLKAVQSAEHIIATL